MKIKINKSKLLEYLNLLLAAGLFFGIILYLEIFLSGKIADYGSHIAWAKGITENFQEVPKAAVSHAGWQWLVIFVHAIIQHSWSYSAWVVTFGSVALTSGILFWMLRQKVNGLLAGSLSVGLLLVAPILLVDPFANLWYMVNGYIGTNVYHNPTILLLKPLAILQFYFSVDALNGRKTNWKGYLIPALCSAMAVYTKPNFALCLLPVICVFGIAKLIRKQPVDWKRLLYGIVLPSTIILVWQFLITYGQDSDSSIVFAPFVVMQHYSSNLLIKLILSLVFPIGVTLVFWKEATKDNRILMGWFLCAMGLIYTYFFAEEGARILSGNFIWSGEISLFILFVSCILFLSDNKFSERSTTSRWVILVTGSLHLFSGMIYYFYIWYTILQNVLLR